MSYTYVIIPVSELPKVDLTQTCITSMETLRFSNDGLFTFIDWLDAEPDFISNLLFEGPFNNDEMIQIVATPQWKSQVTEI